MATVERLVARWLEREGKARGVARSVEAIWRGMTLAEVVGHIAAVRGGEEAVVLEEPLALSGFEMKRWSCQDLARFVEAAAGVLFRQGRVRPGDRVAICTRNGLDMPLLTLAAARCGAVAVPLNHHLRAEEIRYIVEDCQASVLVADPTVLGDALAPWVEAGAMPGALERVVISGHLRDAAGIEGSGLEVVGMWDHLAEPVEGPPPCPVGDDEVCAIFYTSGTTGFPKGAMLTSRSLLSDLRFLLGLPSIWPQALLLALPQAHIMGFVTLLLALLAGLRVVYLPRFVPDRVLDWMESGEVDAFIGVPSMYQMLEEAGAFERDLRGVKVFGSAADVMPVHLIERFKGAGRLLKAGPVQVPAAFVEAYGSVELSGAALVRVSPPWLSPSGSGFVGWPLPGYRVRVVDAAGRALPAGQVGQLQVQGDGVLKGYLGRDEATASTIDAQGWLRTGDLASRSRLGTVHFAGRQKDMIKTGGYSVFPAEIEAQLLQHPAVTKAAVVGLPDARKRAVPAAVVCLAPGASIEAEALRQWIALRVARYKAPREVFIIPEEEMPYGPTGKILKRALVERFGQPPESP